MVAIVIFFSSHPWLFNDSHGHRVLFVVPEVSTKIIFLFEINYEECIAWNPNPWNSKKCFLFSSQSWLWNDSGDWAIFFYSSMRLHQNTSWKSTMKDVSFLKPIHWIWIWFQKKGCVGPKVLLVTMFAFQVFSKTYMVVFLFSIECSECFIAHWALNFPKKTQLFELWMFFLIVHRMHYVNMHFCMAQHLWRWITNLKWPSTLNNGHLWTKKFKNYGKHGFKNKQSMQLK